MYLVSFIMYINRNYSLNSHHDLKWGGLNDITVISYLRTEPYDIPAPSAILSLTRHPAGRNTSTNVLPPEKNYSPKLIPTVNYRSNPPSKTPPVTSTMKTYPFYIPYTSIGMPPHEECIHIRIFCTNTQLTTIQHLANIDISRSLTILHRSIQYVLYPTSPSAEPFYSLLKTIFHLYDTNHNTTIPSTTCYPTPPQNITHIHTP